jgi:hypothetical protein
MDAACGLAGQLVADARGRWSCQLRIGVEARPPSRSQSRNDSVWSAMPSAATLPGSCRRTSAIASSTPSSSSSGVVLDHPRARPAGRTLRDAEPTIRSPAPYATQRVLELP